jgi:hypothetical protein
MRVARPFVTVATATLLLTLAACGGGTSEVVTDATGSGTASPTPTPTALTQAPKPGSLPDFPYAYYSYTLGMSCFCAFVDQRWRITVSGGEVTQVAWATQGPGHQVGDVVTDDGFLHLTIQDILARGNDPTMAKVRVDWPAGQLYPHSVYVDQLANAADDEISYVLTDMQRA